MPILNATADCLPTLSPAFWVQEFPGPDAVDNEIVVPQVDPENVILAFETGLTETWIGAFTAQEPVAPVTV